MSPEPVVTLDELAQLLGVEVTRTTVEGSVDVPARQARIKRVTQDSRQVEGETLFCCISGAELDGHQFAASAVASGAVALLTERTLGLGVDELVVADSRAALALVAAVVSGRPSERLGVVGVTGTNGKTTVVSMIEEVLNHAGRKARSIGTLTSQRTTPEAPELQRLLADMLRQGVTEVALEVSSHALVLNRVDEIQFAVGVFTNLGRDHMDFHSTPEQYFAAKAKLFEPGRCRQAVVYLGDMHGKLLYEASGRSMVGVSIEQAADLTLDVSGSRFVWNGTAVHVHLAGRHNVVNALLAAETCLLLGLTVQEIADGLSAFPGVAGRFEIIRFEAGSEGRMATAVVDYAHTPDALEQALRAARDLVTPGAQLHVVFGCGGDRDRQKRPLMGEVAARLADKVILTTDNPRSENPAEILQEILKGITRPDLASVVRIIQDRRFAIRAALQEAQFGDVILVAGKGHETLQIFADRKEAFDDRLVIAEEVDQ